MNEQLERHLAFHRADYERFAGKPFRHFLCPILHVDEDVSLQRGHVINEAFKGSPKAWVVRRKDVDSFYGTHFEADFEVIQYADNLTIHRVFSDKKLFAHFRPRLLHRNSPVDFFPYRRGPLPEGYFKLMLPTDGEDDEPFVVAIRVEDVDSMIFQRGEEWDFECGADLRLAAPVSLIKAAHLSMFSLLGYQYACSFAGYFVGKDILGRFFAENRGHPRSVVMQNALEYFREFEHMVRPVQESPIAIEGTISDGNVLLCGDSAGTPWGMVVFLKTGKIPHAVMLPYPGSDDSVGTYVEFLGNERTALYFMEGKLDTEERVWRFKANRRPVVGQFEF